METKRQARLQQPLHALLRDNPAHALRGIAPRGIAGRRRAARRDRGHEDGAPAERTAGRPHRAPTSPICAIWPPTPATSASTARSALSGTVLVVGIVHGRCFAGNAGLPGCSDVVIATRGSNISMSGPAMSEGGGFGTFSPQQIGPSGVQSKDGVIDILVQDGAEAVAVARQYLSYFQGPTTGWWCADPRALRHAVPRTGFACTT